jgi:hypothetical protein
MVGVPAVLRCGVTFAIRVVVAVVRWGTRCGVDV